MAETNKVLRLKPQRDRSVERRHPWVFSGAVARTEGEPLPGDLVDVRASGGAFLGRGYYNPASNIVVRLLAWREEEVGPAFWRERLTASVARRERLAADPAEPESRVDQWDALSAGEDPTGAEPDGAAPDPRRAGPEAASGDREAQ